MQVLVMAGFLVVVRLIYGPEGNWPPAQPVPWWALVMGACAYVGLTYAAAGLNAYRGLRRMMSSGGPLPRSAERVAAALVIGTQTFMIAGLAVLMYAGWSRWAAGLLGAGRVPLAETILGLAPFAAALAAYWWATYPLDRAVRDRSRGEMILAGRPAPPSWTRRQYLNFNFRHHFLFIAILAGPVLLAMDLMMLLAPESKRLGTAVTLTVAGAVFLVVPAMIVRVWRTRPLPAGRLRARLEDACRRMRLSFRDIRIWDTGGVIVNAGVMGLIRPVRYVLLSDALLVHMDEEQIESIFAHEAGHVVHHHIPYMVVFIVGLPVFTVGLLSLAEAAGAVLPATGTDGQVARVVMLAAMAGAWGWLFGMLSRRFERQADVYAASVTPRGAGAGEQASGPGSRELSAEGVELFGEALLAVGRLNGISPAKRNYRHGSIRWRLDSLGGLLATGAGRAGTDRAIGRIKLGIWALLAAGAAAEALVLILMA